MDEDQSYRHQTDEKTWWIIVNLLMMLLSHDKVTHQKDLQTDPAGREYCPGPLPAPLLILARPSLPLAEIVCSPEFKQSGLV